MGEEKREQPDILTQAGSADGDFDNDPPMTGHGGEAVQRQASEAYEEIGAVIEGKDEDEIHEPDLSDD